MKLNTKTIIAAAGALLFALAPALASAERMYFLVGVRHVYQIGNDPYVNVGPRETIEKAYADRVADDQNTFQQHIDAGADSATESNLLDQDLDDAAYDRDQQLGALFELRDDLRASHPELQIQGDGPYQVMGIDFHRSASAYIFTNFVVYAPWPGYVSVGGYYGGWVFGVSYQPGIFINLYSGWHRSYGGGRFYGGFYGSGGPVRFAPRGFVDRGWSNGRPGGSFRPSANRRPAGGYGRNGGGTNHSTSPIGRNGGGINRTTSGYGHGGSGTNRTTSGYGHGGSGTNRTTSGYGHGGSGTNRTTSGYGRVGGGNNNSTYGRVGGGGATGYGRSSGGTGHTSSGYGRGGNTSHTTSGSGRTGSTGRTSGGTGRTSGSTGHTSGGSSHTSGSGRTGGSSHGSTNRGGSQGSHSNGSTKDKKKGGLRSYDSPLLPRNAVEEEPSMRR